MFWHPPWVFGHLTLTLSRLHVLGATNSTNVSPQCGQFIVLFDRFSEDVKNEVAVENASVTFECASVAFEYALVAFEYASVELVHATTL